MIKAKLKRCDNNIVTFELSHKMELELGKVYRLDIKPYKSNRSLEQNALLWSIIQQIADETGNDTMDIYITALENANVHYEWIYGLPETENALKRVFRAVKPMGNCISPKGKEMIAYKCWVGSSKYDIEEMTRLIEYVMRIASELNIYIERE